MWGNPGHSQSPSQLLILPPLPDSSRMSNTHLFQPREKQWITSWYCKQRVNIYTKRDFHNSSYFPCEEFPIFLKDNFAVDKNWGNGSRLSYFCPGKPNSNFLRSGGGVSEQDRELPCSCSCSLLFSKHSNYCPINTLISFILHPNFSPQPYLHPPPCYPHPPPTGPFTHPLPHFYSFRCLESNYGIKG